MLVRMGLPCVESRSGNKVVPGSVCILQNSEDVGSKYCHKGGVQGIYANEVAEFRSPLTRTCHDLDICTTNIIGESERLL